ncbi:MULTISPECIES: hypothetical protein [Sphingobacterium]|uniref:Uncharacterized protein n=1 Tax=Sphingobacterium paramultivorum TaxID=2886510 RepID=A0A7G5E149_9SPHI|nr:MULTISPECIES: hypothetical protein [Sphingobacterium]MCS4164979.1 hypothetical protein [Sphingobacterium sp. BIGb0116]QMV67724.1 hypothetical protein HS960_08690 [Sphingobacterium paramultivorum]WET68542.1 MAG: hypothetical protein P0Y57_22155 [Sphingobacterium sp.]WSO16609.1 hypothetical protein VUL84_08665 [Sphingobacterium paramultivorum]
MKRFFLYIFLFLVIGESTMLSQLAKLPKLYQHFTIHNEIGPPITFVEFLSMHYWGQDLPDNDEQEDMKLPFKKYDLTAFSFVFVSNHKIHYVRPHQVAVDSAFGLPKPNNYSRSYISALFRPPQV